MGLIGMLALSGSGYPPAEPYTTMFNVLILLTAVWMVFFWTILNHAVPADRKLFSQASLAMIVIFAALTSINRYVALTVVKQSLLSGNTNGLQWFMPYGWPSIMLAIEFLAWGLFFGLACLCLAPVFRSGRLGMAIFWVLIVTGILSISATLGQVVGTSTQGFNPLTFIGMLAWGPGLTVATVLITIWFKKAEMQSQ